MALPKWTDERTQTLTNLVGSASPVSREAVENAAEKLETTSRSIASKLRKLGFEVEKAAPAASKFTEEQEATLRTFLEDNSGQYTYGEIAQVFEDGEFTAKSLQGKILSMQLTEHVKPTPKPEVVKSYSDEEEAKFVELANAGSFIEDVAEALGRPVNSVRGKALSLLRSGMIDKIPAQKHSTAVKKVDPLEDLGDVSEMSVAEIAEAIDKTPRGVRTMLTRRGLKASDYDGAAKKAKAATA